jgi:hypothetical protein
MAWVSAGYGLDNRIYRAVGFGHLSAYSAEKAAESMPANRESAATNLGTAVGTAVWTAGIASDSRIMQTAGTAVNTASSLTSAVLQWREGKEGWRRELFDVVEMAAFTAGGYTGNPVARAVAFGSTAAGFFWDAKQDTSLVGHGLGAVVWAVGAGMKSNSMQAVGAGVVAAAEATRLAYPLVAYLHKKYAEQPVAAMELPCYERRNSATTAEPPPAASVPMPVIPVAAAASLPLPPPTSSPVSSAASSPVLPTAHTANSSAAPQWYVPPIPASTHRAAVGGDNNVSARPSTAPTQMLVPAKTAVRRASR